MAHEKKTLLLFLAIGFIVTYLWRWIVSRMGWNPIGFQNDPLFDLGGLMIAVFPILIALIIAAVLGRFTKFSHKQTTGPLLTGGLIGIIAAAIIF